MKMLQYFNVFSSIVKFELLYHYQEFRENIQKISIARWRLINRNEICDYINQLNMILSLQSGIRLATLIIDHIFIEPKAMLNACVPRC